MGMVCVFLSSLEIYGNIIQRMIAEKHVDTGAEMHRSRKRKRASKQKSRQVAKQRSRNNKNSSIQRKYLNLLKRNLKINSPPQERVAAKARAQNQAANVCLKDLLKEIAGKIKNHQPKEPTLAWKHALYLISTTQTVISRCGNLLFTAACKLEFPGATISKNSRATAQKLNQTRIICWSFYQSSSVVTAQYETAMARSRRQCQKWSVLKSLREFWNKKGLRQKPGPKSSR